MHHTVLIRLHIVYHHPFLHYTLSKSIEHGIALSRMMAPDQPCSRYAWWHAHLCARFHQRNQALTLARLQGASCPFADIARAIRLIPLRRTVWRTASLQSLQTITPLHSTKPPSPTTPTRRAQTSLPTRPCRGAQLIYFWKKPPRCIKTIKTLFLRNR